MDADTIRVRLREIQTQLGRVEAERSALMTLAEGYEDWLRVYDPKLNGNAVAATIHVGQPRLKGSGALTSTGKETRSSAVKGTVSVRGAIRDVLIAAHGAQLHSAEIWRRAQALGATTDVSPPEDLVDLNLVSIRKRDPRFKKVGVRTFAFIEGSTVEPGRRGPFPVTVGADSGR